MRDTRKGKGSKIPRGTVKVGKTSPAVGGRSVALVEAPVPAPSTVIADSETMDSASAGQPSAPDLSTVHTVASADDVPVPPEAAERIPATLAPHGVNQPRPSASVDAVQAGPHDLLGSTKIAVAGAARTTDEWLALQDGMLGFARAQQEIHLALFQTMLGPTSLSDVIEAQARVAGQVIDVTARHWLEISNTAQRLLGASLNNPDMKSP